MTRNRHPNAFTLVELLVVVSIIALLISILLPSLKGAREQGKLVACAANLHQVGLALDYGVMEHNAYPNHDDGSSASAATSGHLQRIATWVDVLYANKYLGDLRSGYCPKDRKPDDINKQRGAAWGFKYPHSLGGGDGADHSYGISVPLVSAFREGKQNSSFEPNKWTSNLVVASDGWWVFIHGLSTQGLITNQYNDPLWGSNTVGWRHGSRNRPGANFVHRDGSTRTIWVNMGDNYAGSTPENRQLRGVRTVNSFVWRRGEHTNVQTAGEAYNTLDIEGNTVPLNQSTYPIVDGFYQGDPLTVKGKGPNELNPHWWTDAHKWPNEFKKRKGWVRN